LPFRLFTAKCSFLDVDRRLHLTLKFLIIAKQPNDHVYKLT